MAALSFVLALYLRVGDEMLTILEPKLIVLYGVAFTLIAGARVPRDRALPRHLALRLAAGSVQHRARRGADRADLSAGHVPVHPARYAAALDSADRLAGADRAARRAAPRLSPVQGPPPRSSVRARPRRQRAGAADQHQGRRRHVHPRDACATLMRSTAWSACCPTRRRGSAGRSTACRFSARSIRSKQIVADLDRRGRRPQKLVITTQGLAGAEVRRLLDRADALAIPLARLPRLTEFQQTRTEPAAIRRADRARGPARPPAGRARPRGDGAPDPRAAGSRHRRRRHDRLGTGAPDRGLRAGAADPAR